MKDIHQKRIHILRTFLGEYKRLPSYTELLRLFSLRSKNSIHRFVDRLVEEGYIIKDSKTRFSPGPKLMGVRVLGSVEAGFPSGAQEEIGDSMSVDDYLIRNKEATFLLEVTGTSMINAGIHPGDFVLVERFKEAKTGNIIIANVDGEWTMKRLQKKGSKIVLIAENPRFKPIYPNASLNIEGVVIGVIRKYE